MPSRHGAEARASLMVRASRGCPCRRRTPPLLFQRPERPINQGQRKWWLSSCVVASSKCMTKEKKKMQADVSFRLPCPPSHRPTPRSSRTAATTADSNRHPLSPFQCASLAAPTSPWLGCMPPFDSSGSTPLLSYTPVISVSPSSEAMETGSSSVGPQPPSYTVAGAFRYSATQRRPSSSST